MKKTAAGGICLSVAAALLAGTWAYAASNTDSYSYSLVRIDDADTADQPTLSKVTYLANWSSETDNAAFMSTGHYTNKNVWGTLSDTDEAGYVIPFKGTDIAIYGVRAAGLGDAVVYLDDVQVGTINATNSSRINQQCLFELSGLSNEEHALKVVAAKSGGTLWGLNFDYALVKTTSQAASEFALTPASQTLAAGEKMNLAADPVGEYILWQSSDPEVASVKDGVVTALKEGTARILAENEAGVVAQSVITVTAAGGDSNE